MKYPNKKNARSSIILALQITFISIIYSGCTKDFNGYYDSPEGMVGPIYEQLSNDPDFSEFVAAIDKFPLLKNAINTSGLYTVFAPTNDALKAYITEKFPSKSSIADFNINVSADSVALNEIVQMHILFNMYFEYDFNKAIDMKEKANPLGTFSNTDKFKYWTRYKDTKYWYYDKSVEKYRLVKRGYKSVTIYSKNYLNKYGVSSDYEALYGTAPSDFNIDGAQVISGKSDIAAKNGVIFGINKVLEKRLFIDELLAVKNPEFYNLLDKFAFLEYDAESTIAEAKNIANPDSLFLKYYGGVALASDVRDYTILCPTGNTFLNFINNDLLPGFDNSYDSIHEYTAALLINSYILDKRTYSKSISNKVLNVLGDTLSNLSFTDRAIASNGIVYTVSNEILSPAFNSVAKVPLMNKQYSWFLNLLVMSPTGGYSNFIRYLQNQYQKFTLIVPSNKAFKDAGIDYRLDYQGKYDFYVEGARIQPKQRDSIINNLIIVGKEIQPADLNTYQWQPTRSGNFMLFKNGRIQGNIDYIEEEHTNNGYVYITDEFPTRANMVISSIIGNYWPSSNFYKILSTWASVNSTQKFIDLLGTSNGSSSFTVLFPTDSALNAFQADNGWGDYTTDSRWAAIAEYHIIKTKVFSEGTFQLKPNNPLPDDQTKFVTQYADVVHDPANLFEKNEYSWLQLNFSGGMTVSSEDGETANIIAPYDIEGVNGVIHFTDKVLMPPTRIIKD